MSSIVSVPRCAQKNLGARSGKCRLRGTSAILAALVAVVGLATGGSKASAEVISATSNGYSVFVDLDLKLLNNALVSATVPQQPLSTGTAPGPYNHNGSVASLAVTAGTFALGTETLLGLNTGLLTSNATSNVDGGFGNRTTSGQAVVNNLDLGVVNSTLAPVVPSVVTISATTITSNSAVTGDVDALVGSGSSVVENLAIKVLGVTVVNLVGTVALAPNTGVDVSSILGGVSLMLNEQTEAGDGLRNESFATNAIDLKFTDVGVSGIGTLNGQIIIAHSDAQQTAVPEPRSLTMLGLSALLVGFCPRLRQLVRAQSGARVSKN